MLFWFTIIYYFSINQKKNAIRNAFCQQKKKTHHIEDEPNSLFIIQCILIFAWFYAKKKSKHANTNSTNHKQIFSVSLDQKPKCISINRVHSASLRINALVDSTIQINYVILVQFFNAQLSSGPNFTHTPTHPHTLEKELQDSIFRSVDWNIAVERSSEERKKQKAFTHWWEQVIPENKVKINKNNEIIV